MCTERWVSVFGNKLRKTQAIEEIGKVKMKEYLLPHQGLQLIVLSRNWEFVPKIESLIPRWKSISF